MRSATWKFSAKSAASALVLLLLLTPSAHADAASKLRKVRETLALMHMEETTNRLEQAQEARILATSKQQLAGISIIFRLPAPVMLIVIQSR